MPFQHDYRRIGVSAYRRVGVIVLIVAPKLFIEPGTKAPFFKLLSVSGPGL